MSSSKFSSSNLALKGQLPHQDILLVRELDLCTNK